MKLEASGEVESVSMCSCSCSLFLFLSFFLLLFSFFLGLGLSRLVVRWRGGGGDVTPGVSGDWYLLGLE